MSKKTKLFSAMKSLDASLGGAHLTRQARRHTIDRFVSFTAEAGYCHFTNMTQVRGKHLRAYVSHRLEELVAIRTIHNELSHLRTLLRAAGANRVANAPELSNASLGLGGASRKGTNRAATDQEIQVWRHVAESSERKGLAAILGLARFLGLRGNEAIHARLDTLSRWKRTLAGDGSFHVTLGTKGGRPRHVEPQDRDAAMAAIEYAIGALSPDDYLIARADGEDVDGLESARSIWHSWACRHDVRPHGLRYRFAVEQFASYVAKGFSEREALAKVSLDLGHGEGRGRWVKSVYLAWQASSSGESGPAESPTQRRPSESESTLA